MEKWHIASFATILQENSRLANIFFPNHLVAETGLCYLTGYIAIYVRIALGQIEQQALGDYPFSFLRVFIGIPNKKGKAPWFNSWEGTIRASLQPGIIGFDPAPPFEKAIQNGAKTQIHLLAQPLKPDMVCRFLLKMGIEVVAADNTEDVFRNKFNAARKYALTGDKTVPWWYLQNERHKDASHFIMEGVKEAEWVDNVKLEVVKLDGEQEIFHMRLLYLDMFVPLTTNVKPHFCDLLEPDFRLFRV